MEDRAEPPSWPLHSRDRKERTFPRRARPAQAGCDDSFDDQVRLRIDARDHVVERARHPDGVFAECGRVRSGGNPDLRDYLVGIRIQTGQRAERVGQQPDAPRPYGNASFRIGNPDRNRGRQFSGFQIDARQRMVAAMRNPQAAESNRESGARPLAGGDGARCLVGFRIDSGNAVFRIVRNPDRLVDGDPIRRPGDWDDGFRPQSRERDANPRTFDARLRWGGRLLTPPSNARQQKEESFHGPWKMIARPVR